MTTQTREKPIVGKSSLRELMRQGRLAWRLFTDPRVPILLKLIPALAVAYLVSPIDFVPDFFPPLGQLDDLAVVLLALRLFVELAPPAIVAEHKGEGKTVTATYRVQDE